MTVSSSTNSVILSANGTAHSFAFTFKIFAAADLQVIVRSTAGVETVKTLNSHYIIADSSVGNANGGNVLFKYNTGTSSDAHYSTTDYRPANNEKVILRRAQPKTQGLDLVANDPFPAESFEESLDKLTFMVQDVQEAVDRSFKFSRSNTLDSSGSSIASSYSEIEENTTSRANKLLSFDSTGVPIATQEIGTLKGNWAASTVYQERDIVKDTSTSDHYIVNTAHTSSGAQPLTTNANSAKYTAITNFASSVTTGTITASAIISTTSGTDNFIAGQNAGDSIATGGNYGVYIGHDAGTAITTGDYNVAIGDQALKTETNTNMTVAVGHKALSAQINGSSDNNVFNTAVGARSGEAVSTGQSNTFIGGLSGLAHLSGQGNTALGVSALYSDQLTNANTAIGFESLKNLNLSSSEASAVSYGSGNTALGWSSGYTLSSGTKNTFLGQMAGYYVSTGKKNTVVGSFDGNEGGLDIRTSDNYIVLSDGDGNPRLYMTNTGAATFASTVTATGFIIGSADINENDLEAIDGVTAGTVAASKVVTVDTNKDFSGARNITLTGELDAGSLDISGDADIAGTTNLDNTDIDGTLVVDGSNISLDSTSTLNIDNSNTSNGITIGTATSGVPVSIGHSTSETTVNDNLNVTGNLVVNGTTQTTNSTTVTIDDPIFTLGGDTAPGSDDNKDRGIEFRYHDGSSARIGFFGYDDSASAFTVFTAATNSSEVFSGTTGNAIFGNITGTLQTAAQTNITSVGTLSALTVSGLVTADGGIDVDDFHIDGTAISLSAGNLSIDAGDNILLNTKQSSGSGGATYLKMGGTTYGGLLNSSGELVIQSGSTPTTAVTFSGANATFAGDVVISSTNSLGVGGAIGAGYAVDVTGLSGYDDVMRLTAVGTNIGARLNLTNTGTGVARLNATNNSLVLQTGGSSALTLDSSQNATFAGKVGIGGVTPSSYALDIKAPANTLPLRVSLTTDSYGYTAFQNSSGDVGYIGLGGGAAVGNGNANTFAIRGQQELRFATGGNNEALLLDTSQNATFAGDVSVGTGAAATGIHSLAKVLEISGGDGGDLIIGNNASSNIGAGAHIGAIAFKNIDTSPGTAPLYAGIRCEAVDTSGNMDLRFYTGTANLESDNPQVYISSGGSVLVGKTATGDNTINGVELTTGTSWFTATNDYPLGVNREGGSDGTLIKLYEDAVNCGEIAAVGDRVAINSQGGGLTIRTAGFDRFHFDATYCYPQSDDAYDLGSGSNRLDDVFATNGTIQTSDQNEKQDIASMTTAELAVGKRLSTLFKTFRWKSKVTEKADKARTHSGIIAQQVKAAFEAESLDATKYAMFCSNTFWEKEISVEAVEADEEKDIQAQDAYTYIDVKLVATEGYTEKTRMGIRYPELLSFVASYNESRFTAIEARLTALEGS